MPNETKLEREEDLMAKETVDFLEEKDFKMKCNWAAEPGLIAYLTKKVLARDKAMREDHFAFALKFIHSHDFDSIHTQDMVDAFEKRESIE